MADLASLRAAVIEKQDLILNRLTSLSYEEVMKLMASLSSLITNLDKVHTEEEVRCNKLIVGEMGSDPRTTFSKAEAVLKTSETYSTYKNVMSLKQCAARGLNLAKFHAQYLLKSKIEEDPEGEP